MLFLILLNISDMCIAQEEQLNILFEQKNIDRLMEQDGDSKTYLTKVIVYGPTNLHIFWGSEMNEKEFQERDIEFCLVFYLYSESKLSTSEDVSVAYFSRDTQTYKIYESSYLNQWNWRESENDQWMPMSYEASKGECVYIGDSDNEELLAVRIWKNTGIGKLLQ